MADPVSPQNKRDIKTSILPGLAAAWPICLGYVPIGLAFGVLAQKAGLYPIEITMMSILVFAGTGHQRHAPSHGPLATQALGGNTYLYFCAQNEILGRHRCHWNGAVLDGPKYRLKIETQADSIGRL